MTADTCTCARDGRNLRGTMHQDVLDSFISHPAPAGTAPAPNPFHIGSEFDG